jgi:hypothetical protein
MVLGWISVEFLILILFLFLLFEVWNHELVWNRIMEQAPSEVGGSV